MATLRPARWAARALIFAMLVINGCQATRSHLLLEASGEHLTLPAKQHCDPWSGLSSLARRVWQAIRGVGTNVLPSPGSAELEESPAGAQLPPLRASSPWQDITSGAVQTRDFEDGDDVSVRKHWALIVAGSAGWSNYRHQADACHAYQVLRRGGLLPQHIVTMMYNDIANNHENPYPGQIFNRPGGPDVYAGVVIDYQGQDVTAANLLAVLEGNAAAVAGVGSGRVINSGPHDRIFVFYSDHGSPGVLGMPAGDFLYADQLMDTLRRKHQKRGYTEAVLYIEACESGSMFEGMLDNSLSIFATTAANPFESSWGTYCPGMDPSPEEQFSTCLGDLFSVAWMENAELADLTQETIKEQVDLVLQRTSNNFTYIMGSHVMQYGALDITAERAGDYEGMRNTGESAEQQQDAQAGATPHHRPHWPTWLTSALVHPQVAAPSSAEPRITQAAAKAAPESFRHVGSARAGSSGVSIEQRAADLVPLHFAVKKAKTESERTRAQAALAAAMQQRSLLDASMAYTAQRLLTHPAASNLLMPRLTTLLLTAAATSASSATLSSTAGVPNPAAAQQALLPLSEAAKAAVALLTMHGVDQFTPSSTSEQDVRHHMQLLLGSAGMLPLTQSLAEVMVWDGLEARPSAGRPLVDDWVCLRGMVAAWEAQAGCGPLGQYGMRHTRFFANLCNLGVSPALLQQVLAGARGPGSSGIGHMAQMLPCQPHTAGQLV